MSSGGNIPPETINLNMIPVNRHREWRRCASVVAAIMAGWQLGCAQDITPPSLPASALALEEPLPAPGQSALRVANIRQFGDPIAVDVPVTITAGEPATVAVTTYANSCITEDTTIVDVHAQTADVVPFQRVYKPNQDEACSTELQANRREVDVVFAEPGSATLNVYGRRYPDGGIAVATYRITVE